MELTDRHISIVRREIQRRGISSPELQIDILDHVCIMLEDELQTATDFNAALSQVLKSFPSLHGLQLETTTEINSSTSSFRVYKFIDYLFTFLYLATGIFTLVIPLAALYYRASAFLLIWPMLIYGCIICFTRINYRKFELIPFSN